MISNILALLAFYAAFKLLGPFVSKMAKNLREADERRCRGGA